MSVPSVGGIPEGYPEAVARGIASSLAALCSELGADYAEVEVNNEDEGFDVYLTIWGGAKAPLVDVTTHWFGSLVMPR